MENKIVPLNSGFSPDEEVDKILNSVQDIQRAEVPAFFYTRLEARMQKNFPGVSYRSLLTKPVFSILMLCLLLVLNITVMIRYIRSDERQIVNNTSEGVQVVAQEFNLTVSSVYNEKTIK